MADQEAEENLNTNPTKNVKELESDRFMQPDEIAFIVDNTGKDKDVIIIGLNVYNTLIDKDKSNQLKDDTGNNDVTKDNAKGIIFKLEPKMDCDSIGNIDIESITNKKYIREFETAKNTANVVIMTNTEKNKGTFKKDNTSAIDCNKSIKVKSGTFNEIDVLNTSFKADGGDLIHENEGGKPRRKRNKASMKKYKKRKSSTGKKKKIPRRRSRKLRRRK